MNVQVVQIAIVGTGSRRRPLDRSTVKSLADSIAEVGLMNPITVCPAGSEFTLVAGRHRLEAARSLGWREIPATVVDLDEADRHLAEIDENLIRNELSDLERAEHIAARKGWYEAKHPEAAAGSKRAAGMRIAAGRGHVGAESAPTFAADTALRTRRSERTVQEDVQIGESIPEDVRDAIRDTPLAESKTDLLALARLPEERQREVVQTADLSDKRAVRQAVAEHQMFVCRVCGNEQTMKTWHCDGCGEHWLPGDLCGECQAVVEPDDDCCAEEDLDVQSAASFVSIRPTVEAFAAAIVELFTPDERAQISALINNKRAS